jgi:hypothetical protein
LKNETLIFHQIEMPEVQNVPITQG